MPVGPRRGRQAVLEGLCQRSGACAGGAAASRWTLSRTAETPSAGRPSSRNGRADCVSFSLKLRTSDNSKLRTFRVAGRRSDGGFPLVFVSRCVAVKAEGGRRTPKSVVGTPGLRAMRTDGRQGRVGGCPGATAGRSRPRSGSKSANHGCPMRPQLLGRGVSAQQSTFGCDEPGGPWKPHFLGQLVMIGDRVGACPVRDLPALLEGRQRGEAVIGAPRRHHARVRRRFEAAPRVGQAGPQSRPQSAWRCRRAVFGNACSQRP